MCQFDERFGTLGFFPVLDALVGFRLFAAIGFRIMWAKVSSR